MPPGGFDYQTGLVAIRTADPSKVNPWRWGGLRNATTDALFIRNSVEPPKLVGSLSTQKLAMKTQFRQQHLRARAATLPQASGFGKHHPCLSSPNLQHPSMVPYFLRNLLPRKERAERDRCGRSSQVSPGCSGVSPPLGKSHPWCRQEQLDLDLNFDSL